MKTRKVWLFFRPLVRAIMAIPSIIFFEIWMLLDSKGCVNFARKVREQQYKMDEKDKKDSL